ncbi:hypothetical protein LEMLEM_LOCUS12833, partial [Lemmus lemmus]
HRKWSCLSKPTAWQREIIGFKWPCYGGDGELAPLGFLICGRASGSDRSGSPRPWPHQQLSSDFPNELQLSLDFTTKEVLEKFGESKRMMDEQTFIWVLKSMIIFTEMKFELTD